MYELCFFFFFQAEDGIRDYKVTGVQTCALPIWSASGPFWMGPRSAVPAIRNADRGGTVSLGAPVKIGDQLPGRAPSPASTMIPSMVQGTSSGFHSSTY